MTGMEPWAISAYIKHLLRASEKPYSKASCSVELVATFLILIPAHGIRRSGFGSPKARMLQCPQLRQPGLVWAVPPSVEITRQRDRCWLFESLNLNLYCAKWPAELEKAPFEQY